MPSKYHVRDTPEAGHRARLFAEKAGHLDHDFLRNLSLYGAHVRQVNTCRLGK